jgi:Rps23 Pro-64 3,4-dihydroxylase Tpa1-like proline 4-hydroxylase
MWLNAKHVTDAAIGTYQQALLRATPRHIVIDNLFNNQKLLDVIGVLQRDHYWQMQQHSYSALYVDNAKWLKTRKKQRFVQRAVWQRSALIATDNPANIALQFLQFLRGDEFLYLLSRIFKVQLTDITVAKPDINTNYFRLGARDFVNQHADDSPGREVCMLLYLNKDWQHTNGGELVFMGKDNNPLHIAPLFNRCVLFAPSSLGSEHWVNALTTAAPGLYRYNVTSWYWSE